MDIEIGRAPDYVMRRGQEILNHRMKLVIHSQSQKIFDEIFTSRSLAMVLREGRSTFDRQSAFQNHTGFAVKIESVKHWGKVVYETLDQQVEFIIYLPFELSNVQATNMIGIHTAFFRK